MGVLHFNGIQRLACHAISASAELIVFIDLASAYRTKTATCNVTVTSLTHRVAAAFTI